MRWRNNYSKWRTREGIKNLPEYGGTEAGSEESRAAQQSASRWKVAVISDIHANRHAFEATLDAVAASDAAELWCLGRSRRLRRRARRLRGAGPRACRGLPRREPRLAVTGEIPLDDFSLGASLAAQWTRR